jgi:hypothetical protein
MSAIGGLKARYFNGKNASGTPLVVTILGLFGLGYTIDYQSKSLSPLMDHSADAYLLAPVHLSEAFPLYLTVRRANVFRIPLEHHKNHAH